MLGYCISNMAGRRPPKRINLQVHNGGINMSIIYAGLALASVLVGALSGNAITDILLCISGLLLLFAAMTHELQN